MITADNYNKIAMQQSRMFGFINSVDKVIWSPKRDSSADVSSVNPSSHLSTLVVKPNIRFHSSQTQRHSFFRNKSPYYSGTHPAEVSTMIKIYADFEIFILGLFKACGKPGCNHFFLARQKNTSAIISSLENPIQQYYRIQASQWTHPIIETQILLTLFHIFLIVAVGRICLKINTSFLLVINSFFLITCMFEKLLMMEGEIRCLSLKGLWCCGHRFPVKRKNNKKIPIKR